MTSPEYVYVASSWRNPIQPRICSLLRRSNIDHYDFRNPEPGSNGFHWTEVMPGYVSGSEMAYIPEYLEGIKHPIAEHGFALDFNALNQADTVLLLLPCGRSAHLELGYAVGAGKRTCIYLGESQIMVPELMYKMVDHLAHGIHDLMRWLDITIEVQ